MAGIVTAGVKNTAQPTMQNTAQPTMQGAVRNTAQPTMQKAVQNTAQINTPTEGSAMGSPISGGNVPYDNEFAGVRQSLKNAGIQDIGWDGKNVTVGGKAYLTPQSVKDGTSYASKENINRAINQIYADKGDRVVSATQYASASGLGNLAKWDNETGTVSIGGMIINPLYVSDGIAYVKKSDVDGAVASVRKSSGVDTPEDTFKAWQNKYGKEIESAKKAVDDFHYDPTKDSEYQAYAAYQMKQKEKLAKDAAARAMDASGGYGGANIAAAASSLYDSQQDIAAAIPEYARQAYNRKVDNLENTIRVGNENYNKDYTRYRDAYNYYQAALDADRARYNQEILNNGYKLSNEYQAAENYMRNIDKNHYAKRADMTDEMNREEVYASKLANQGAANDMLNTLSMMGGRITGDTAKNMAAIMPDGTKISLYDIADGNLPNPWDYLYKSAYMQQKGSSDAVNESSYEAALRKYNG